jgi:hypothetical protein
MYSGVPISVPTRVSIPPSLRFSGERLRHSEIDDLRHRPPVHLLDKDVGRFQVAMDNRLVMRVLHSFADRNE